VDQIDAFINRLPDWLDETGAMAEPDLGVLRELLMCRATVLGHTDPWRWPEGSLVDTVMEVASEGDASEVTMTLRGEPAYGPIGAVFARVMQGQVERDNRRSVEAFAELAARELGASSAAPA